MGPERRKCQNCQKDFTVEPEDFDFYEKMQVPPPTWCPECRLIRRYAFWNTYNLYRAKDSRTGKEIFSTYHQDADIKVYEHDYWWSDAWDPMSYGQEVDFARPFLAQLQELSRSVPWPNLAVRGMVRSEYCNQASNLKDCYLCFNGGNSEDSMYSMGFQRLRGAIDSYAVLDLELCYELYQSDKCFQCFFCRDISSCRNVWFSQDCIDCSDCFGCVNLRHKQFCIFNKQYSKEEYQIEIQKLNIGSYLARLKTEQELSELYLHLPHKYLHGLQNTNVTGDYVYYSKNAHNVYEAGGLEDVRYSENLVAQVKDCYDYTNWGQNSELVYESVSCGDACRNIKFCFDCWPAMRDSEYCLNCHSSADLFGCVGLRNKQYCILNQQYSAGEYRALVERIKKNMNERPYTVKAPSSKHQAPNKICKYGEFFPIEFSHLAYNESVAADYYPKTHEEAEAGGFVWRNPSDKEFKITMPSSDLPDHVQDAADTIPKEIIGCGVCRRGYRILSQELEFYRRFSLPLPRLCHKCRYSARTQSRNSRTMYVRQCDCRTDVRHPISDIRYQNTTQHFHAGRPCPNEFHTSYSPERPEIIYCEVCYNTEVA